MFRKSRNNHSCNIIKIRYKIKYATILILIYKHLKINSRLKLRQEVGRSGDSTTTSSTLYEGRGVRSAGDASDTLGGGDASGADVTGMVAVGEYTGFAKLNVFSPSTVEKLPLFCIQI